MRQDRRGLVSALLTTLLTCALCVNVGCQHSDARQTEAAALREAYAEALATGNEGDIRKLLALLPQEDGRYVYWHRS
jgi:hypothetical protein